MLLKLTALAAFVAAAAAEDDRFLCFPNVVPGYSAPFCDFRIAAANRLIPKAVSLLASDPFQNANKRLISSGFTSKAEVDEMHTDTAGKVWQIPAVVSNTGTNHFEDWDPSQPMHCAMLCNLDDECVGFTFKLGQCWLSGSGTYTSAPNMVAKTGWITYWKSTASARTSVDAITSLPHGEPFQSAAACDAYYSLKEPCTYHAVAGTASLTKDDTFGSFSSSDWDKLLPLDDGTGATWAGSAPGAFSSSLASASGGKLQLDTMHSPAGSNKFDFPTTDADCGCSYDTYVTSMTSGKSAVGYGYYEATFSSSASQFVNAFWFQGDQSEINVLKVENGVASVSWYCFADQNNQQTDTLTLPGTFDVGVDHTATLHWTAEQFTILVDGEIKMQRATPSCLQGTQMKPIFSVEVGDNLPSTTGVAAGASFGKMTVNYFRSWSTSYIVASKLTKNKGNVACKALPGDTWGFSGLYNGPVPSGNWVATCGQKLLGVRKLKVVRGTIAECGNECDATVGCAGFWMAINEGKCRLYHDFLTASAVDKDVTKEEFVGNVWFTHPPTYTGVVPVYPAKLPMTCEKASSSVTAGFTESCFQTHRSFGLRATIDLDDDGVIEFGCPYTTTMNLNAVGNLVPKACKHSQCTPSGVCPGDRLPQGFINKRIWDADGSATKNWGGSLGVIGALDATACVKICSTQCSCVAAAWRARGGGSQCWLMSRDLNSRYRNQASPNQSPIKRVDFTYYLKDSGATCDRAALISQGRLDA